MVTKEEALNWRGRNVVDRDGDKIGKLQEIYLDDQSGAPEWGAVSTGLLSRKLNLVPLEGSAPDGDDVRVAYGKGTVKGAPEVGADDHLTAQEEEALYRHYGLSESQRGADAARDDDIRDHDTHEHQRDDAPDATGGDQRPGPQGEQEPSSDYERTREERERVGEQRHGNLRKYTEERHTTEDVHRTETEPTADDPGSEERERR